jgi:organic radical activating enzyme
MDKYVETNMSFWQRLKFLFTNLLKESLCPTVEIEKIVIKDKIVKVQVEKIIQVPVKETIIERYIENTNCDVKKEEVKKEIVKREAEERIPFFELADTNVKSNI